MITKQEAGDLIFAGVLGCLDRADIKKLNEYMKKGGELPATVGEFQNIAAMLPVILKAENPPSVLKDKVARKLYRVKDEVRAKVLEENLSDRKSGSADIFYKNSRENRKSSTLTEKVKTKEPEKFKIKDEKEDVELPDESISISSDENIIIEEDIIEEIKPEEFLNEVKQDINLVVEPEIKEEIQPDVKQENEQNDDFEPVTPNRNTFESFKSTREKVLDKKFDEIEDLKESVSEEEVKPEPKLPTREKIKTYEKVSTREKSPRKTLTKDSPSYRMKSTKERGKSFERAYKKKYVTEEMASGKKSSLNPWLIIGLFIVLLAVVGYLYFNFITQIKDLKSTNDTLKQQVTDLSVKFNNTQEMQSLLESTDVNVINLQGTGINPGGHGKLIISRSQSKGYIQLSDMPALGADKSYQLWMQLPQGNYFSLGVFNPSGRVQYFPFQIPKVEGGSISEFIVTEETSSGAVTPGNKIFLTGNFQ
jgi:anti-sigma-K factor RskA